VVSLLKSYVTTSLVSKAQLSEVILVMHIKEREHMTNHGLN